MRQSLSEYDDRDDGFSLVSDHRGGEPRGGGRRGGEYGTEEQAAPSGDRRLPKILLAGGAMAIFAGGLWFAYVQGTHRVSPNTTVQSDGVPLLKADAQPTKAKPDNPGGAPMPSQNLSLYNDKPGSALVEKLLPPAEKPMPKPVAPPPPPPPPAASAKPDPAAPALGQPVMPPETAASAKASTKPAEPKTAAATPVKTDPAAAKTGAVSVRVGSVRSPEAAKDEWVRLKHENGDILGSLKANAVRADLGDKGIYYRIEAGPFSDTAAAEKLCAEMKRRSLGCILAR